MIDIVQFRDKVVRPALAALNMRSPAAERLLLGTAVQESGLRYLHQIKGPAIGLFQMEPATHADILAYLRRNPRRYNIVAGLSLTLEPEEMAWNLQYAAIMARLHYWRDPAPLPAPGDGAGLAEYWKRVYNTNAGRGTAAQFAANYKKHVSGLYP